MGLFNGILDDIQFKGGKTNVILKWIIGLAVLGIVGSFAVGQYKISHLNKLNDIESLAKEGIKKTEQLEKRMERGFEEQNVKIDKIYDDGVEAFNEYRKFNNEQLKLVVDYGRDNKQLLKKMLELNSREKAAEIKSNLEISKRENSNGFGYNDSINKGILPLHLAKIDTFKHVKLSPIKPTTTIFTKIESPNTEGIGRKTYYVINAPKNYLDTLNRNKYEIIKREKSNIYKNLYNFVYRDK